MIIKGKMPWSFIKFSQAILTGNVWRCLENLYEDIETWRIKWEGEKETLAELRQIFEVAAAQTLGLVNLVFAHQTSFFKC